MVDATCAGGGAQNDDTNASIVVQYDARGVGAGVGAGACGVGAGACGVGAGACTGAVAADCTAKHCW